MSDPKEDQNLIEDFKNDEGVYDLDALIKKSNDRVIRIRIQGKDYKVNKLTKKVIREFNKLGAELKVIERKLRDNPEGVVEDEMSPHELASRQLACLLSTPLDIFDEVDLIVVKNILDFVMEKIGLMGESIQNQSK